MSANTVPRSIPPSSTAAKPGESDRGLILIPDISGYTAFVHAAHAEHAQEIVTTLLEALIQAEQLGLELCDIEGDALFFYRAGEVPNFERIIGQVDRWHEAFHHARRRYRRDESCACGACANLESLSLKIVAHYGRMRVQQIAHLRRLFGADVILAHRLLKNSLPLSSYFLFTEALAEHCEDGIAARLHCERHAEDYPVFGRTRLNFIALPIARSTVARGEFAPKPPPPTRDKAAECGLIPTGGREYGHSRHYLGE